MLPGPRTPRVRKTARSSTESRTFMPPRGRCGSPQVNYGGSDQITRGIRSPRLCSVASILGARAPVCDARLLRVLGIVVDSISLSTPPMRANHAADGLPADLKIQLPTVCLKFFLALADLPSVSNFDAIELRIWETINPVGKLAPLQVGELWLWRDHHPLAEFADADDVATLVCDLDLGTLVQVVVATPAEAQLAIHAEPQPAIRVLKDKPSKYGVRG